MEPRTLSNRLKLAFRMIIEDLSSMPVGTNVDVKNDDSRKALSALPRKFRLCITSPPYLNSFDYSDVYRPELFLMEMVRNTQQLRKIRLQDCSLTCSGALGHTD